MREIVLACVLMDLVCASLSAQMNAGQLLDMKSGTMRVETGIADELSEKPAS